MTVIQIFDPLDTATEAALRASIKRFGVLVPVVQDQNGRTLDGHHRSRIADELGVPYRVDVREVADEDEAQELARTLNADRRHLTPEQRRQAVVSLRKDGHSYPAISRALKIDVATAHRDFSESGFAHAKGDRTRGQDGKSYPASRAVPVERDRRGRAKPRQDKTARFVVENQRHQAYVAAHRRRLVEGLSSIQGLCKGLGEIDYGMAITGMSADEIPVWIEISRDLSAALKTIHSKIKEASRNGEHPQ